MSRLFRCLVFAAFVSFSACGPMIAAPCSGDSDCEGILVCASGVCVVPDRRADAGRDAGNGIDAGSVDVDAGSECVPAVETCNGIDDDCDGIIDNFPILTALDGGSLAFDGGVASVNGVCTVGVGACANSGMTACMSGSLACSAMPHAPGVERCNLIDDDCDGQTDENDPGVCSVTGQLCTSGSCACPSGQSVCNGACTTLGTEVCDGQDNDCDGQIDEGVTITCLADADGDGYATDATTSQQCADAARTQFGSCPVGFVAPTSSSGVDCNPTDATKYRLVSSRSDSDADTYCAGTATDDCVGTMALAGRKFATDCSALNDDCDDARADRYRFVASKTDGDGDTYCTADAATMDCVGTSPLAGRRFSTQCANTVDCDDSTSARYQMLAARADSDGDGYCAGASTPVCSGAQVPSGWRVPTACIGGDANIDCNDSSGSTFRLAVTAQDADGDGYCTSTGSQQCIGANPPAGFRMANTCNTNNLDCNDNNANLVRNMTLRADADADGWCSGNTYVQCVGPGLAPAGTQFASNCAGNDCRDSNSNATQQCSQHFYTPTHVKACGIGIPTTQDLVWNWSCAPGFHRTQIYWIFNSGTDVATELPIMLSGTSSGTALLTATCRPAVIGEKGYVLDVQCEAD